MIGWFTSIGYSGEVLVTQRQARQLISGPCLCAKAMTQSRAVTGLLTGRNTSYSPLCRRGGAEDETSVYILCECGALVSIIHAYLASFFLEPEDI